MENLLPSKESRQNDEKSKKILIPNPPILKENFESFISLTGEDADITEIKDIALRNGFREQTAPHITIMSTGGEAIKNWLKENPAHSIKTVKEILCSHSWQFTLGKIYHIKSNFVEIEGIIEKRESYIRAIKLPDIEEYFKEISLLVGVDLPVQFPHITLFTKGERPNPTYYGIPIPSLDDFKKMSPEEIM